MNALPLLAWCGLMCGLTALLTSLFWHAAYTRLEEDTETLTDALLTEVAR